MSSAVLNRCKVSTEQLDLLLSFMEDHPDFAAGKSIYSRFSSSKLWRLLAERLNAAADDDGGARKSADKWCRYWADIKYKTRRKSAAGGALGDLSSAEERLQNILGTKSEPPSGHTRESQSDADEERKPPLDDDMFSEGSGGAEGGRLSTEELLAEAAMRSALAAEKQAEAVSQAVDLLREMLAVMRERAPFSAHPHAAHSAHSAHAAHTTHSTHTTHTSLAPHAGPHAAPHNPPHNAPPADHSLAMQQHHHHRL